MHVQLAVGHDAHQTVEAVGAGRLIWGADITLEALVYAVENGAIPYTRLDDAQMRVDLYRSLERLAPAYLLVDTVVPRTRLPPTDRPSAP